MWFLRGLAAAALGLSAAHLVAAALDPATSPVLVVGSEVVDRTPTPVKEWAIAQFGTADKPLLVGGVLLVTLLVAGGAGVLAARRPRVGSAVLVLLAAVAGGLALARPGAVAVDVVPSVVAALVAAGALLLLRRDARVAGSSTTDGERPAGTGRRAVLGVGLVGLGALALGSTGEWLARARARVSDIVLPRPAQPAPPLPTGLEEQYAGITPLRTPTADFYRVDTRLALPTVDPDDWRLTIDGDVGQEVELTLDDLLAMPLVERDITMTCVSNEVGGRYVGAARWTGVPLTEVLALAGVRSMRDTGADQILSTDVDGFTISTPLEAVLDGREPLVAVGMNGEALPRAHGFPARLVTPGLYGFVGSTKWLRRLTLTTFAEQTAYWTEREWATDAPVKVASRIDVPRPLATLSPGTVVIGGVAWAQRRGVERVEVRVDGGAWQECELGPAVGVDYWRQWFYRWDASPGSHLLAVRATDGEGEVQTAVRATPFPAGSSGVQEIAVRVEES